MPQPEAAVSSGQVPRPVALRLSGRNHDGVRASFAAAGIIASAAAASAAYQRLSDRADRRRYPPPGRLVDIGGRNLHLVSHGTGTPSVIVVPALADDVTTWIPVVEAAAEAAQTTVHVYDRAGCGWASPASGPVTYDTMADDLHALIAAAGIGPCIVAGHSIGGIIARRLHSRHPEDVTGLLLIDSSHEEQPRRLPGQSGAWDLTKRLVRRQTRILGLYRLAANLGMVKGMNAASYAQNIPPGLAAAAVGIGLSTRHRRTAVREIRAVLRGYGPPPPLGRLPVTVITSLTAPDPGFVAVWKTMQDELAALSPDTIRIDAGDAGHFVHRDDPGLVVQAVTDLVKRCR